MDFKIKMAKRSTLHFEVERNIKKGYNDMVCLACYSSNAVITYNNWNIIQKPAECKDMISVVKGGLINLKYNKHETKRANATDFFLNEDRERCPLTNCQIMKPGCHNELN